MIVWPFCRHQSRATVEPEEDPPPTGNAIVSLPVEKMRARRHPMALIGLWAWQAALALVVGAPAAAMVGGTYGAHPQGEAALWEPGGRVLLDFIWRNAPAFATLRREAELLLVISAAAGLVPAAAAMYAMAHRRLDQRPAGFVPSVAGALAVLPSLGGVLVLFGVTQGLVLAAGTGAASLCAQKMLGRVGEALAQQIAMAVGLAFLLICFVLAVLHDLTRAAIVRFGVNAGVGFSMGLRAFRRAPASLCWGWSWRTLSSLAPAVAVAAAPTPFRPTGASTLVLVLITHQIATGTRVALRASWLAKALRSVKPAPYSFLPGA
ncbi:MAG: hypothetical protein M3O50_12420 [Myxococcota bacterium]|nr:hypothetical protein [Myxococcota bacterium]